jgi:hypothetical protein
MASGRVVFKPLSAEKQTGIVDKKQCVVGKMKPQKKEWKPKQSEELAVLRERMMEPSKAKLMLR